MLVAAAFVPTPPLLVPEIGGGTARLDDGLRRACHAAVRRLLDADVDELVLVGTAGHEGLVDGSWDWRGFGRPLPDPPPAKRLPLALAIGSWLVDACGASTTRHCRAVTAASTPSDCAALGRELVTGAGRIGLLICGDGSACRTDKAPGSFDPAAEAWDTAAVSALRDADPAALLALDAELGRRLLAAGRAPWQVLAGAAADGTFGATIDWADAPYGVMYVAGTWTRSEAAG